MGCKSPFSARIVCGECGGYFGRKVWGSRKDDKRYRRYIWQCNDKYKGDHRCITPHITEDDLKARFLTVWNGIAANRENIIADCRTSKNLLCDCKTLTAEIAELERDIEVTRELSRKAIFENAHHAQNQAEWNERNDAYLARITTAQARIEELTEEKRRRQHKARILESYIKNLEASPLALAEFDDKLWVTSIDCVVVGLDGLLTFRFLDGSEVAG